LDVTDIDGDQFNNEDDCEEQGDAVDSYDPEDADEKAVIDA
jgi:hypothetical protein